jgi:hypothetical protein
VPAARIPADVADVHLVGARPDGHAERIAQSVGDDPPGVDVGVRDQRVVRQRAAGERVNTQQRAVERHRIGRRAEILTAQRPAFGRRGGLRAADRHRRIASRINRAAVLPVVHEVEASAVAAGRVERAVGAKREAAERVARVLLEPVLDQDALRANHDVA